MMTRNRALILALGLVIPFAANAQYYPGGRGAPAHQHFDGRFAHNHPYYDRGYAVPRAPIGGYGFSYGRDRFWYHGGNFYRWGGGTWIVGAAPVGVFIPVLPPYYTTVWWGGIPYYYANDTYYNWNETQRQYQVANAPPTIDSQATTQPPATDDMFVYPNKGQSDEQQATDRFECHRSSVQQTGYDTTQTGGGVAPEVAAGKRTDYFRSMRACMKSRGYSVE